MTEADVENYETTTRGSASMAAYRAVRILQLLSENTGEDKALLSDELVRSRNIRVLNPCRTAIPGEAHFRPHAQLGGTPQHLYLDIRTSSRRIRNRL